MEITKDMVLVTSDDLEVTGIEFDLSYDGIIINGIKVKKLSHKEVESRGTHGIPFELEDRISFLSFEREFEIYSILNEEYRDCILNVEHIPLYVEVPCVCSSCLSRLTDKEQELTRELNRVTIEYNDTSVYIYRIEWYRHIQHIKNELDKIWKQNLELKGETK